MSRFELVAGSRMPDEFLGLGAVGDLPRLEVVRAGTRVEDPFEERVVLGKRLVEREDVVGFEMRDDPLRLERPGVTLERDDWLVVRLEDRAVGFAGLRLAELREEEVREDVLGRARDAVLDRLGGRDEAAEDVDRDAALDDELRLEELAGRSLASAMVVARSTATQVMDATMPAC